MPRFYLKALAPAAVLIASLSIVSPVSAADTSFAIYTGDRLSFVATRNSVSTILTEIAPVTFSFLNTNLAPFISHASATLIFSATGYNSGYKTLATFADQELISGTYSFISTQAYKIGGTTYAANSNLLTVVFSGASVFGKLGSADSLFSDDTVGGGTVTYTSDFLKFGDTDDRDFAISLGAITPKLGGTTSLNPFTATPTGSFASDPVPLSTASLPEPASWAMMLAGLGTIGLHLRGSTRRSLRTA